MPTVVISAKVGMVSLEDTSDMQFTVSSSPYEGFSRADVMPGLPTALGNNQSAMIRVKQDRIQTAAKSGLTHPYQVFL